MFALFAIRCLAAPVEDRLELQVESGFFAGQTGVGLGLGGAVQTGRVVFGGSSTVVGRIPFTNSDPLSDRIGIGLATLELGLQLGKVPDTAPFGFVVLVDGAALDATEQDCSRRLGCRHTLFVAPGQDPEIGYSVQPAVGARLLGGLGPSGLRYSALAALQPTTFYDDLLFVTRVDFTVWHPEHAWSAHVWGSRYGFAFGVGRTLTAPASAQRRRDP